MKLQVESLRDVRDEIGELLDLHYEELAMDKEIIQLDPDWGAYEAMERDSALRIYTVREAGRLVGYSVFFLIHPPHYRMNLYAQNDIVYLAKEFRESGHGLALVQFCRERLLADGAADKELWHAKPGTPLHRLLLSLGYVEQDVILGKRLR